MPAYSPLVNYLWLHLNCVGYLMVVRMSESWSYSPRRQCRRSRWLWRDWSRSYSRILYSRGSWRSLAAWPCTSWSGCERWLGSEVSPELQPVRELSCPDADEARVRGLSKCSDEKFAEINWNFDERELQSNGCERMYVSFLTRRFMEQCLCQRFLVLVSMMNNRLGLRVKASVVSAAN